MSDPAPQPFQPVRYLVVALDKAGIPALFIPFRSSSREPPQETAARLMDSTRIWESPNDLLFHPWHIRVPWNWESGETPRWPIGSWEDHPIEITREYVFDEEDKILNGESLGHWTFKRIGRPMHGNGHGLDCFNRTVADRRPELVRQFNSIHSADARADEGIHHLHMMFRDLLRQQEKELVRQKGRLREDDPTHVREMERLAGAIAETRNLAAVVQQHEDSHFVPAARVKLTLAMIYGHGVGDIVIRPVDYQRVAHDLVDRLMAGSAAVRDADLMNMVANLRSDHDRAAHERLVPREHAQSLDDVDIDRLFDVIKEPPPQFGSGPAPDPDPDP